MSQTVHCSNCGAELPLNNVGACSMCGDLRRTTRKELLAEQPVVASTIWQRVHRYYDKHPVPLMAVLAITVGAPFLGLVVDGWRGVWIGVAIDLFAFFLGLRAVTRVREIENGRVR